MKRLLTSLPNRAAAASKSRCDFAGQLLRFMLAVGLWAAQAGGAHAVNYRTEYTYTSMRQATASTDPLGRRTEIIYDAVGRELKNCVQAEEGAAPVTCDAATQTTQTFWTVTTTAYTPTHQPSSVKDPDGFSSSAFYDALDRPQVTVDGAGRKARTVYDAAGRPAKVIRAWAGLNDGTSATLDCAAMRAASAADPTKLQQCYQEYSYTPNGQIASVTDANGNKTTYEYDGYDRLKKTIFPSKTLIGQPSTADPDPLKHDYEEYAYDANGNMVSKRAREGRVITFFYDSLNRLMSRVVPGSGDGGGAEEYTFTYDLAGRRLSSYHYWHTTTNTYDAAGRLISHGAVSYQYDSAGNVTRLTYPDGYFVTYSYDALNRVTTANESGTTTLANLAYDPLSRRSSVAYGNGTSAKYGYTNRGDLTCHDWNFAGAAPAACNLAGAEAAYDFAYNGVGQLIAETISDPLLRWSPAADQTDIYAKNGLNQYTAIAATPAGGTTSTAGPIYDDNGNIAKDHRGRDYTYDAENLLMWVYENGVLIARYVYDGEGNRRYKWANGDYTQSSFDGDQEIYEVNSAGQKLRRYVRLPGSVDEPFLMIEYDSAGAETNRLYAHQNRLGSVVAVTNSSGAVVEKYRYGPYGELTGEPASGFPFRFTGQKLDAETGLYYYKARFYDPDVGRFLQTDPIGYDDQMNLYAYVHNDPVNNFDPTGEDSFVVFRRTPGDGRHAFVVVTDDDGNVVRQYSYGPQNEGELRNPGQLVAVGDDPGSDTRRDDAAAWQDRDTRRDVRVVSLTDMGIEDDDVIASGDAVNEALGTRDAPGDTPYQVFPRIMSGEGCNSNCAAAGVVEGAQEGASGDINPPARTPGWRDPIEIEERE